MALGSHARICNAVPAAGAPEPASMHRSRVLPLLYAWIRPPAMFWLVVLKVYVARSERPGTLPMAPVAESVPCARSSAYVGVTTVPPPAMQEIRFATIHASSLPCGLTEK